MVQREVVVRLDFGVRMVFLECKEGQVSLDSLDNLATVDHPESRVNQELKVALEMLVALEILANRVLKECQVRREKRASLEAPDLKDWLVVKVPRAPVAIAVYLDCLVQQDCLE